MKRILFILTIMSLLHTSAYAGVIYFKNGNMLEGEIIKISPKEITIKYNFGLVSFPKNRIELVESSTEKESLLLGGKKRLTKDDLTAAPIVLPYFDTHEAEKKNKETVESSQKAISAVKLLKEKLDLLMDKKKEQIQEEFDAKANFYRKQLTTSRQTIKDQEKEITKLSQTIQDQQTKLENAKVTNTDLKLKIKELEEQTETLKSDKLKLIDEKKTIITEAAKDLKATVKDLQTQHDNELEKLNNQFQHDKEVLEKLLAATTNEVALAKEAKQTWLTQKKTLEEQINKKDEALNISADKIARQNREIESLNKKIYVYQEKMDKQAVKHEEEKIVLFKSIVDEALRETKEEDNLQLDKKNMPDKIEVEDKMLSEKDKLRLIEYLREKITFADKQINDLMNQVAALKKSEQEKINAIGEHVSAIEKLKQDIATEKEINYNLRNKTKDLIKAHKKEIARLKETLQEESKKEKERLLQTFGQERKALQEIIDKTSAVFEMQQRKEAQMSKAKEIIDSTIPKATPNKPTKVIGEISELEIKLGRIFLDLNEEVRKGDTLYVLRKGNPFAKLIIMKYYPSFKGAIAKVIPAEDIEKLKETDKVSR